MARVIQWNFEANVVLKADRELDERMEEVIYTYS